MKVKSTATLLALVTALSIPQFASVDIKKRDDDAERCESDEQ